MKEYKEAIKKAEDAVSDMKDGPLKVKAFETILSKLIENKTTPEKKEMTDLDAKTDIKKEKSSISGRVLKLKESDFFVSEKGTGEVCDALATKGHVYQSRVLAVGLLRLVRKGELRRIKHGKNWTYVNP